MVEYRIEVDRSLSLPSLHIDVELSAADPPAVTARIEQSIQTELLFRAELRPVPPGSLPRFEMKAHRVVEKTT